MIKDIFKKILFNNKRNNKVKIDYNNDILINIELIYHSPIVELSNYIINKENDIDNSIELDKEDKYTFNTEETVLNKKILNSTVLDYINNPIYNTVLYNTFIVFKLITNLNIEDFILNINNTNIKIEKEDNNKYIIYSNYMELYKYFNNLSDKDKMNYINITLYNEFKNIIKTYIVDKSIYNTLITKNIIDDISDVYIIDEYYLNNNINYITFVTNNYDSLNILFSSNYDYKIHYINNYEKCNNYIISINQVDLYDFIIENKYDLNDNFKTIITNNINTNIVNNNTSNNINNDSYYTNIDEVIN